jgi:hypothetical protein
MDIDFILGMEEMEWNKPFRVINSRESSFFVEFSLDALWMQFAELHTGGC